ncbi:MAG: hypothetical protein NT062_31015 [Proteobacteria bacterium]|nr:hypothetical protein [Pseudomonadota bacterium]
MPTIMPIVSDGPVASRTRQPEVEDLHVIAEPGLLRQHDVRGLDVAVHDAELVGVREPRQHLPHDLDDADHRESAAHREEVLEVVARDEVHDDERPPRVDADVDHRCAVRVLEPGHRHRLDLEPLPARQLLRQLVVHDLDGHDAPQLHALGAIHDAHGALGDGLDHAIATVQDRAGEIARVHGGYDTPPPW